MKTLVVVTRSTKKASDFAMWVNEQNLGYAFVNRTDECSISGANDEDKLIIIKKAKTAGYKFIEV